MYQNNTKMTDVDILNMLIKLILNKVSSLEIDDNQKEVDKDNKTLIDYIKILIQVIKIKNSIDDYANDMSYENIIKMIREEVKIND